MSSTIATRDDVIDTFGKLPEATIANVLSLRVTPADLVVALARLRSDSGIWNCQPSADDRTAQLCELLAATWQSDDHFGTD